MTGRDQHSTKSLLKGTVEDLDIARDEQKQWNLTKFVTVKEFENTNSRRDICKVQLMRSKLNGIMLATNATVIELVKDVVTVQENRTKLHNSKSWMVGKLRKKRENADRHRLELDLAMTLRNYWGGRLWIGNILCRRVEVLYQMRLW